MMSPFFNVFFFYTRASLTWNLFIILLGSVKQYENQISSVFFQFLWPLLGKVAILQNVLHLLSHNMLWQTETFQQTKVAEIFCPQKVKVGQKTCEFGLKNTNPNGVSPPWGSPAISLPLLLIFFCINHYAALHCN